VIREARLDDAPALVGLIAELGYPWSAEEIAARLAPMLEAGEPPLVFEEAGAVIGVLVWHVTPTLHRAGGVGRTVMFVVGEAARGRGVGRAMLAQAEARFAARGCVMAEVTSNVRREQAHAFYEGLGYERTSYRFGKAL
jgi:ribosomal protein S18 acetylase RimI-like enzyme